MEKFKFLKFKKMPPTFLLNTQQTLCTKSEPQKCLDFFYILCNAYEAKYLYGPGGCGHILWDEFMRSSSEHAVKFCTQPMQGAAQTCLAGDLRKVSDDWVPARQIKRKNAWFKKSHQLKLKVFILPYR